MPSNSAETKHPSTCIRPTGKEIRDNLLKDLEKPGYVVITHTGEILHSKEAVKENEKKECPKSQS